MILTRISSIACEGLSQDLQNNHFGGRKFILPDKEIAIFRKYVGSMEAIMSLKWASLTITKVRRHCTDAVISNLLDIIINWPSLTEYYAIPIAQVCLMAVISPYLPHLGMSLCIETEKCLLDRVAGSMSGRYENHWWEHFSGISGRAQASRVLKIHFWEVGMQSTADRRYTIVAYAA